MDYYWISSLGLISPEFMISTLVRLLLAVACGGIVGYERENNNHPAGLRTHVLVCLGAALVMILSEYMSIIYGNSDPARMGAQVISGIGFLGAGTIIKEGISVRGLTTAATLWAVSCVGLSIGSGFYAGALLSTIIIYITLRVVKKIVMEHYKKMVITILCNGDASIVGESVNIIENSGYSVIKTAVYKNKDSKNHELRLYGERTKDSVDISVPLTQIRMLEGVDSATLGHGDH